ncbi:MAG: hypothetical protein ACK4Z8_05000 [Novosphingobium sp.]
MTEVINLFEAEPEPSLLCCVFFYRRRDGSISARLMEMDGQLIETTGDDVQSRMETIADWIKDGAADMREQSKAFGEPA